MQKPFILACFLCSFAIGGCVKDEGPGPGPAVECKLQYVINGTNIDSLAYDQQFRLSRVKVGSLEMTYNYNTPGKLIITKKNYTFPMGKNTITFNGDSLITNIHIEEDVTGGQWTNRAFEYDGKEIVKEIRTTNTTTDTFSYTWAGGNIVSETSTFGSASYGYYPAKDWKDGDFSNTWHIFSIGVNPFPTKNLVKDFRNISPITYAYDSLGNVSQMSASGESFQYKYLCR